MQLTKDLFTESMSFRGEGAETLNNICGATSVYFTSEFGKCGVVPPANNGNHTKSCTEVHTAQEQNL